MTRALIVTPAAPGSRAGNRNTAARWARMLRALGWRARIATAWDGARADLLVALHARRSHASLRDFRASHPGVPCVLALTGTDIYRDVRVDPAARRSLDMAERYIVLQPAALDELEPAQRERAHVIAQSETAARTWSPLTRRCRLCVLGHLREEKDPFRAVAALGRLPHLDRLELLQAGAALSAPYAAAAHRWMAREPRYRWLGEITHGRSMRLLAASHAMVISSRMEGGAHVVSEAIVHGVPVIASDIAGNRGMLGPDYPAYFPVGDDAALARLIARAATDDDWLEGLHRQLAALAPNYAPAREQAAWAALLADLGLSPG